MPRMVGCWDELSGRLSALSAAPNQAKIHSLEVILKPL